MLSHRDAASSKGAHACIDRASAFGVSAAAASSAFIRTACDVDAYRCACVLLRGGGCTQAEFVRALKGLVLPHTSHSGEIAMPGSRRLHSILAVAPVLSAHAVATVRSPKNE